jgi:hypothetical protein
VVPGERTYLVGEPFSLSLIAENAGTASVRVPNSISDMGSGLVTITIRDDKGNRSGYDPYVVADIHYSPKASGIVIPPRSKHTVWLDLTVQGEGVPVWAKPGTYTVEASYAWKRPEVPLITEISVASPPVEVKVVSPTGREAKAYAMMLEAPSSSRSAAAAAHYRKVMAQYPGTRWARWAHLRLAERLAYGLSEQQGGGMVAAVREYRRIVASYPGFPFVDWARYCVATGLESAGQLREAQEEQERLLKRAGFPDSLKAMAQAHLRDISRKLSAPEHAQADDPKPVVPGRPKG